MKYLKFNPQRGKIGFFSKFIINLLKRKYNVCSHYSLYLKYFIDYLNLNDKKISVCEIGGGDGWALSYENKKILEKVMIDYDEEYKDLLKKKNIHFIKADIGKDVLNIKNQFNLIILNHVIEHVFSYDIAIKNIYNLLKPGGYVIIRCPNILKNKFHFWDDFTHVKPYTPTSLKSAFQSYGFKTITITKFSYNKFIFGFLFNKRIQKILSRIGGNEILYIGKK